jgi:hypothetical protein
VTLTYAAPLLTLLNSVPPIRKTTSALLNQGSKTRIAFLLANYVYNSSASLGAAALVEIIFVHTAYHSVSKQVAHAATTVAIALKICL